MIIKETHSSFKVSYNSSRLMLKRNFKQVALEMKKLKKSPNCRRMEVVRNSRKMNYS